jgi:hypothetical protein
MAAKIKASEYTDLAVAVAVRDTPLSWRDVVYLTADVKFIYEAASVIWKEWNSNSNPSCGKFRTYLGQFKETQLSKDISILQKHLQALRFFYVLMIY